MLERLADEIPRFFTEPNMIFPLRALVLTFVLSSVGVSIGFAAGFLISCLRRMTHWKTPCGRPTGVVWRTW